MDTSLNSIAEMKRVLNLSGLITQIYYESPTYLIFSSPRFNKVIKLTSVLALFVGDAWTSGSTITNEIAVNLPYSQSWGSGSAAWFVVTPDIMCFTTGHPTDTKYCNFWAIGKLDTGDSIIISSCSNNQDSGGSNCARWYNSTTNEQYTPTFSPFGMMTDAGNYFNTFDIPFKTAGTSIYRPGALVGAKFLFKAPSLNEAIQIFNPDVVVSFRYFKTTQWLDFQCSLLILNGNV